MGFLIHIFHAKTFFFVTDYWCQLSEQSFATDINYDCSLFNSFSHSNIDIVIVYVEVSRPFLLSFSPFSNPCSIIISTSTVVYFNPRHLTLTFKFLNYTLFSAMLNLIHIYMWNTSAFFKSVFVPSPFYE